MPPASPVQEYVLQLAEGSAKAQKYRVSLPTGPICLPAGPLCSLPASQADL